MKEHFNCGIEMERAAVIPAKEIPFEVVYTGAWLEDCRPTAWRQDTETWVFGYVCDYGDALVFIDWPQASRARAVEMAEFVTQDANATNASAKRD